jgi:hypothetical protein
MTELKYAKNIITGPRMRPMPGVGPNLTTVPLDASDLSGMQRVPDESKVMAGAISRLIRLLWLDDEVVKGGTYMDFVWYTGPAEFGPGQHVHDFDEIIGFLGTDVRNPKDLGGQMELWLDNEKYNIDYTCLVFVPKGLKHCPMIARRVDRPFIHFTAGNQSKYEKSSML